MKKRLIIDSETGEERVIEVPDDDEQAPKDEESDEE